MRNIEDQVTGIDSQRLKKPETALLGFMTLFCSCLSPHLCGSQGVNTFFEIKIALFFVVQRA
ncbi:MAG: hypothetical protein JJU00_05020 [Opitutales bacterium]|nr:hypothetical protein [Opitutales bacterium]